MSEFSFFKNFDDLDQESKYLAHKAKDAANHAHAPYSKFTVGAALILEDGTVITGANYENAAYPSGMCAERVALFAAAAQHPDKRILKMAVVAKKKGGKELLPATSCGPCRQVMLEFETNQKKPLAIVMQVSDNSWVIAPSAASLLPFSFTKDNLEAHPKK
ncbi:MAG: cytidine deaminase [Cyclobacteriaceae bacterium]|nr:cytidine deaminase [Cyclobacteriaceae bacterium]UYN86232.1 MAG: cytidine deaminase [Cyclobacteriaceae bacterium]